MRGRILSANKGREITLRKNREKDVANNNKSEMLCPAATPRCDTTIPASWATFYNLEVVIALAFRLNTYEASRIRQKVLESLTQRKMEVFNLFFALKISGNDKYYHKEQSN